MGTESENRDQALDRLSKKIHIQGLPDSPEPSGPSGGAPGQAELPFEARRDLRDLNEIRLVKDMRGWNFLDEVATPQLYQSNAFRITGLHTTVSLREAKKLIRKKAQAHKLGLGSEGHLELLPVDPLPSDTLMQRSVDHVLSHPHRRLVHELFWFWPESSLVDYKNDRAVDALRLRKFEEAADLWDALRSENGSITALHNSSVLRHFQALELEQRCLPRNHHKFDCPSCGQRLEATKDLWGEKVTCPSCDSDLTVTPPVPLSKSQKSSLRDLWTQTFDGWSGVIRCDSVWDYIAERALDADPASESALIDRIRGHLPFTLLSINAEIAVRHAMGGKISDAKRQLQYMEDSPFGHGVQTECLRRAAEPHLKQLFAHADQARRNAAGPRQGLSAAKELLTKAAPITQCLGNLDPNGAIGAWAAARDKVAESTLALLISYANETNNWSELPELTESLKGVAASSSLRDRIDQNLAVLEQNVAGEKLQERIGVFYALCGELATDTSWTAGDMSGPGSRSNLSNRGKYDRVVDHIIPKLTELWQDAGPQSEAYTTAANVVGMCLRGICVDLHNKDESFSLAVEGLRRALALVTDPEMKARVKSDLALCEDHNRQKKAQQRSKLVPLFVWGGIILFFVVIGNLDSCDSSSSSSKRTTSRPSSLNPRYTPSSRPASSRSSSSRTSLGSRIDADKRRAKQMESDIEDKDTEISSYRQRLQQYEQRMNRHKTWNEIDEYNALVPVYNSTLQSVNGLVEERNDLHQEYSNLIDTINANVNRYNRGN